jgi:peptidoglycan/LPS O-acetylase OafA/YrhL
VVIVNELESKQLANPVLVWIGKLSYGIYLWHYFVFKAIGGWHAASGTKLIVALLLTLLCATASYYLVERRFLELKERFA